MEEIEYVIKRAKDIYANKEYDGMCYCLFAAILPTRYRFRYFIETFLPGFCYDIAVEKFGATGNRDELWWNVDDRDVRLKYFDWLIEKYSMQSDSECEQNPHGV